MQYFAWAVSRREGRGRTPFIFTRVASLHQQQGEGHWTVPAFFPSTL